MNSLPAGGDLAKPTGRSSAGFLTLAIGARDYIDQAYYLGLSLKANMPAYPIAVVTDDQSGRLAGVYDHLIPARQSLGRGVRQKMYIDQYSPFEETLFIDADCIAARPFEHELNEVRGFDFSPVVQRHLRAGDADEYFLDLPGLMHRLELPSLPKFNGGVYFFRKSALSARVFESARRIQNDPASYGLKAFDSTGPGDEPAYALAMAQHGISGYDDQGRLMRTPVSLRGKLTIDPTQGQCSFMRAEGLVTPAICHFAGDYRFLPEYYYARIALERNCAVAAIPMHLKASTLVALARQRAARRLRWLRSSLEKRVGRISATIGLGTPSKNPEIRR
ncbi:MULTISPECIES: hypothetical protein [Bradyrhizobium]|uniref:hypothetical protein n=1 Tax=Bradyrhizobium TaxID=374 RepID=UPI00040800A6|nr:MULTISPECIES: hypothetical protein [Bradyrhizobium]QOG22149.1 hypothetical protein FOM02_37490 [Bradyrhizobium sp. SEMIA]UFW51635.1 hypothetical protein BaraCB756_11950 [Bradyrhizobium arachidis]